MFSNQHSSLDDSNETSHRSLRNINLINDINSNTLRNLNPSNLVLNERLIALSCKKENFNPINPDLVESLPTEGFIFSHFYYLNNF